MEACHREGIPRLLTGPEVRRARRRPRTRTGPLPGTSRPARCGCVVRRSCGSGAQPGPPPALPRSRSSGNSENDPSRRILRSAPPPASVMLVAPSTRSDCRRYPCRTGRSCYAHPTEPVKPMHTECRGRRLCSPHGTGPLPVAPGAPATVCMSRQDSLSVPARPGTAHPARCTSRMPEAAAPRRRHDPRHHGFTRWFQRWNSSRAAAGACRRGCVCVRLAGRTG